MVIYTLTERASSFASLKRRLGTVTATTGSSATGTRPLYADQYYVPRYIAGGHVESSALRCCALFRSSPAQTIVMVVGKKGWDRSC